MTTPLVLKFNERDNEKHKNLNTLKMKQDLFFKWKNFINYTSPFKCQPHKMVKHTQTVKHTQAIRRQIVDELFECVWPFCGVGG